MMTPEEAKILLQRYRMGLCTPEERQSVEDWYDAMAGQNKWQWTNEEKAAFENTLRSRIQNQIAAPEITQMRQWFPRIAAAAVFIIMLGGAWIYFKPVTKKAFVQTLAHRFANDIAPGRNAAVLTLADGSKIILDEAKKGILIVQGGSNVNNIDGKLAYQPSNEKTQKIVFNTLTTQNGNQYQLVLPDGSKVWLNAASSITYPSAFIGSTRNVTITGEAYFEVMHNGKQPFIVKAGNEQIEDIGTAFNVNAYMDEAGIKTTLIMGAVKINNIVLEPGQQYVNGKVESADVESATAWKNGKFQFDQADIPAVMRQVSRWYNVEVVYEGSPKPHGFTGKIPRDMKASQVLTVLEEAGVHFRIETAPMAGKAGKIIVTP